MMTETDEILIKGKQPRIRPLEDLSPEEIKSCESFMSEALKEAEIAGGMEEVPIGCVIVKDGEIIARAHNSVESDKHPLAHAEMKAIDEAVKKVGWRLGGCDMYVTLEPCEMCMGAISWARIANVYVGTKNDKGLNHSSQITFGIMQKECYNILVDFFKNLRRQNK